MLVRRTRAPSLLLVSALGLIAASCRMGPSQQRVDCLDRCGTEKDRCLLEADTASEIQTCDAQSKSCNGSCGE
jgi:hypothetical protein